MHSQRQGSIGEKMLQPHLRCYVRQAWLIDRTCSDVARLIVQHACAMCIQACVRRHFLRHVHRTEWRQLRSLLSVHPKWDTLLRNHMVRREWRQEPQSWIQELRENGGKLVEDVATEVDQGLWTSTSHCAHRSSSSSPRAIL